MIINSQKIPHQDSASMEPFATPSASSRKINQMVRWRIFVYMQCILNPKESLLSCRSYLEVVHALPGSDVVGENIIYKLLYHAKFEKKSRASRRTKSRPAEEERVRQPVGQKSAVGECYCQRHHRPRALRVAPVCKEPPVAQARGLRDQSKSRREVCLEFGGEPEVHSKITCQRAGTSSARSTAPGEERWYGKYHRPRSRLRALRKCTTV